MKKYLSGNMKDFISYENDLDGYTNKIRSRKDFSLKKRELLSKVLLKQNKSLKNNNIQVENIKKLKFSNTFTITTGHQLCLFTGPIFFIIKILQVIKICKDLENKFSDYNFVPIFWMATEDHDFEEIKCFNTSKKEFSIEKNSNNKCVGSLDTLGFEKIYHEISEHFDGKPFKNELLELYKNSYLKFKNIADATRHLVHEIFKDYGLVVLDPSEKELKNEFKDILRKEISGSVVHEKVTETIKQINKTIDKSFKQVNPRKINLFYIDRENVRSRIKLKQNHIEIDKKNFSENEILNLVESAPENFSPNVLTRPIYQEFILPNLSYVGGPSEIAYWIQLKSTFDFFDVSFPILSLRNSMIFLSTRDIKQLEKLNIQVDDFFKNETYAETKFIKENNNTNSKIDIKYYLDFIDQIRTSVQKIDENLVSFLNSIEKKQIKDLNSLEKKIIKSQKEIHQSDIKKISAIRNKIFFNGKLMERKINFSEYYSFQGKSFIDKLYRSISQYKSDIILVEI